MLVSQTRYALPDDASYRAIKTRLGEAYALLVHLQGLTAVCLLVQVFPAGTTLLVPADLRLRSCNNVAQVPILDFAFFQGRIRLASGVELIFENIIMKNARARSGYTVDILLNSPNATLECINTTRWLAACVPATPAVIQEAVNQPRAPGYPGQQNVTRVEHTFCIRGLCFPEYLYFVNYTASNLVPFTEGADEVRGYLELCTGRPSMLFNAQ